MYICMTGQKQVLVRSGFSDYDTYRSGYIMAATGNLDAPDYIPQGSVRLHCTGKPNPAQSMAHRDDDNRPLGCGHDGSETAQNVTHWAE